VGQPALCVFYDSSPWDKLLHQLESHQCQCQTQQRQLSHLFMKGRHYLVTPIRLEKEK